MAEFITNIDFSILNAIYSTLKCAFMDIFMLICTYSTEGGFVWILAALICLCFPKSRKTGLVMGLALIMGITLGNGVLKGLVMRSRPYTYPGYEHIESTLLIKKCWDSSFPSGHSLSAFEGAVPLLMYKKKYGIPALVLALLVAFSRMYIFVHFPSDVLAGAALGTLFALVSYLIINALYKKFDLENKLLLPKEKQAR